MGKEHACSLPGCVLKASNETVRWQIQIKQGCPASHSALPSCGPALPQNVVDVEFSRGSKSNWMNSRKKCPLRAIKNKSFHQLWPQHGLAAQAEG